MDIFEFINSSAYLKSIFIIILLAFLIKIWTYYISKFLPYLSNNKGKIEIYQKEFFNRISNPLIFLGIFIVIRVFVGSFGVGFSLTNYVLLISQSLIIISSGIVIYHFVKIVIMIGFDSLTKRNKKIRQSFFQFSTSVLKIFFGTIIFLFLLSNFGIEIGPLLAGLGVAGIAIAFALQSSLKNVFGGIAILLDRAINVGDTISTDDGVIGEILSINLWSTKIKNFDNELVIIPNSKLSEGNIRNISLPEPRTRVSVPFSVSYGSEISKVKEIVLKEINTVENLLIDPDAPVVRFLEMADSSLNFKAYFYVNSSENSAKIKALDEANTKIYNALRKNKIQIPFPQMDVYLRK